MITKPFIIINPNANTGKMGEKLDYYLHLIKQYIDDFDYAVTTQAREEIQLAKKAIGEGYKSIVACGGDGTATNIADVLIDHQDCALGLLSGGSMCDWHKTQFIPYDFETSLKLLVEGHKEKVPALKCTGDKVCYSFDMADTGFAGAAAKAAHTEAKWLKTGTSKYSYLAVKYMLKYGNKWCTITLDDKEPIEVEKMSLLFAGLGEGYVGFKPLVGNPYLTQKREDFGVLLAQKFGKITRGPLMLGALRGTHVGKKNVWLSRAKKMVVESIEPLPWEAEGEIFNENKLEVTIEYVSNAITMILPKNREHKEKVNEEIYDEPYINSFRKRKYKKY